MVKKNGQQAHHLCALGYFLQNKGQLDQAILAYEKALKITPRYEIALYNLASSLHKKGEIEKAKLYYRKVLEINPDNIFAYNNLGAALQQEGNICDAIIWYKKALRRNPDYVNAHTNLASALLAMGSMDDAEAYYRRAIYLDPRNPIPYHNLLNALLYNPKHDVRSIFCEHLKFAERHTNYLSSDSCLFPNDRTPDRRLKIGYVSPDFRRHSVSHFIEPVIAAHDREYFEVYCYSNSSIQDKVTERIKGHSDHWRDILGISDDAVVNLIRRDQIDILIDLTGHTANNRIMVFAKKPAPVQMTWIGYPATTGISSVDYKIVDNNTDPPDRTDRFYSEKLIRLPGSFLCYCVDNDTPLVGDLPAATNKYITFGSFNNFIKVAPEALKVWIEILRTVPTSRLIMKTNIFADKTISRQVKNKFLAGGIDSKRILLLPHMSSFKKHMDLYNMIDIGLDTFPYNGVTTTCEALWMGVPVISLAGTAYASRIGVSLLSNVGLGEFIAGSHTEYINTAVMTALDIGKLKYIRTSLRDRMMHSPLMDTEQFVQNLEYSYSRIWKDWVQSRRNGLK